MTSPNKKESPNTQLPLFSAAVLHKPDLDRLARLEESAGSCTKCALRKTAKKVVFGSGNTNRPDLAFVGEAPGPEENREGVPFIGRAGVMLTNMLKAMHYERKDVYSCNTVKCYPPNERGPFQEELKLCYPYLFGQLQSIQPKVIVALGAFAGNILARTKVPVSVDTLRNGWQSWYGIPVKVTYHPAAILEAKHLRIKVWIDLRDVMQLLNSTSSESA